MHVRPATAADEPLLRELWAEFEAEVPPPPEDVETWEAEWRDVSADIEGRGAVFLAEDEEGAAGSARASDDRGRGLVRRLRLRPSAGAPAGACSAR